MKKRYFLSFYAVLIVILGCLVAYKGTLLDQQVAFAAEAGDSKAQLGEYCEGFGSCENYGIYTVHCTDNVCGGDGSYCIMDETCASGYCNTKTNECEQPAPQVGDTCEGISYCESVGNLTVHCTDGICGGTGSTCIDDSTCASGYCNTDKMECEDPAPQVGETCDGLFSCENVGIYTVHCTENVCGGNGSTCVLDDTCASGYCEKRDGETAGTCQDPRVALGEACEEGVTRCEESEGGLTVHCSEGVCGGNGSVCIYDETCASGFCDLDAAETGGLCADPDAGDNGDNGDDNGDDGNPNDGGDDDNGDDNGDDGDEPAGGHTVVGGGSGGSSGAGAGGSPSSNFDIDDNDYDGELTCDSDLLKDFVDCDEDLWWFEAMAKAVQNGDITGYEVFPNTPDWDVKAPVYGVEAGMFKLLYGGGKLTYEQLITMLVRATDVDLIKEEKEWIASDWAQTNLDLAYSSGLIDDTTFDYAQEITRKEAVKLVLIAAGINYEDYEVDEIPYPDVTDLGDDEYTKIIVKATDVGFVQGADDGNFYPEQILNRAEVVTIINRGYENNLF